MAALRDEAHVEPPPREELDIRDELSKQREKPMEDLIPLVLMEFYLTWIVHVGSHLKEEDR